jgi:hypothetical protein
MGFPLLAVEAATQLREKTPASSALAAAAQIIPADCHYAYLNGIAVRRSSPLAVPINPTHRKPGQQGCTPAQASPGQTKRQCGAQNGSASRLDGGHKEPDAGEENETSDLDQGRLAFRSLARCKAHPQRTTFMPLDINHLFTTRRRTMKLSSRRGRRAVNPGTPSCPAGLL